MPWNLLHNPCWVSIRSLIYTSNYIKATLLMSLCFHVDVTDVGHRKHVCDYVNLIWI